MPRTWLPPCICISLIAFMTWTTYCNRMSGNVLGLYSAAIKSVWMQVCTIMRVVRCWVAGSPWFWTMKTCCMAWNSQTLLLPSSMQMVGSVKWQSSMELTMIKMKQACSGTAMKPYWFLYLNVLFDGKSSSMRWMSLYSVCTSTDMSIHHICEQPLTQALTW